MLVIETGMVKELPCADDLSATLCSRGVLTSMLSVFDLVGKCSGLLLRPRECVRVLNSIRASPHNIAIVRAWLRVHIPAWAAFLIANSAKYLGFQMGPIAFCWQWDMPIRKFKARIESIAASGESAAVGVTQYSMRAVPILLP